MAGGMKKLLLIIVLLSILIFVSFYLLILKEKKVIITIIYTTDLQGFIAPSEDIWFNKDRALIGGSASFSTYIKKEREISQKQNRGFFLLDTGNFFSGQAEGYFLKGESVIEIMNRIGYDALVIGPKDFAFGVDHLKNLSEKARFSFLSANIVEKETGKSVDFLNPYIIKQYKGIKIGFIGITTPSIFSDNIRRIRILDPILLTQRYVSLLKAQGVNLIIILSNLGLEEDKRLAEKIEGINIIIGGNDKGGERGGLFIGSRHKTFISPSVGAGVAMRPLYLTFDLRKNKLIKYYNKYILIYLLKFKPDLEIQAIIQRYTGIVKEKMKEIIGYTEVTLSRVKDKESDLGNWIAEILREKTKANICLVGGLEANLKQGEITIGDIYNILPINEEVIGFNLAILEMTGEQIKEMLEIGVSYSLEKGEGILQVSGLRYAYDLSRKKWDRVIEVEVDGEKLDLGKIYKVAVNGYLASGLGGYYVVNKALKRYDTGLMDLDVLVEYIKNHSPITAQPLEGRIVRIE